MNPSLRTQLDALRDRLRARRSGPRRAPGRGPYRVASPPPRAPRPSPARLLWDSLRALWTVERVRAIVGAVAVGLAASGLFTLLLDAARFASPRVSEPATHVLALPFGVLVGLVAALVFLAFGAAALVLGVMLLTSVVYALTGLARAAWQLLVVLPRELLARDGR